MEIDVMTDSISAMKLTETKSFEEKWWHMEVTMNFDIENAKQLLNTPEHKKDRSHYFFEKIQVRLLKEKLCNLQTHERNNAYGEFSKTKEFQDLKRSAAYWTEKLSKESIVLKEKLGNPDRESFHRRSTDKKTKRLVHRHRYKRHRTYSDIETVRLRLNK